MEIDGSKLVLQSQRYLSKKLKEQLKEKRDRLANKSAQKYERNSEKCFR
jgi:hypothetical protein